MCHNVTDEYQVLRLEIHEMAEILIKSRSSFLTLHLFSIAYCYQVLTLLCEYSGEPGSIQYFIHNIVSSYEECPPFATSD